MGKKLRFEQTMEFVLNCCVISGLTVIFGLLFFFLYPQFRFYLKGYILTCVLYAIILILFMNIYGGFQIRFNKIANLVYSIILSIIMTLFLTYIQASLNNGWLLDVKPYLIIIITECLFGGLLGFFAWKIFYSLFKPHSTLLLYQDEYECIDDKILKYGDKNFLISKVLDINTTNNYLDEIMNYDYVLLINVESDKKNIIIKKCYEIKKSLYIIPSISDILINNAQKLHFIDTPLLNVNKFGASQISKVVKRLIDIIVSLVAIIILFPIYLLVALAIKLNDGGPIFYKQTRLTKNGQEFGVLKFRSMKVDAEKDGVARLAKENDDRITSVGKFIRKVRLDELPQLFNILKGDMSLVGPRPERPEIANEIYKDLPEFKYRLTVKAGLTGYAQVYGKYNTSLKDKLLLDLMYIENYSLILDIKIMLMTIKILFMKESTEGVE